MQGECFRGALGQLRQRYRTRMAEHVDEKSPMITRHNRTHGVGLLAGLSLVSSSVLGMFLASGPGSAPAAKTCAAAATATRAAVQRPATGAAGSHIHLTALA